MKEYIEERVIAVANYIVENNATVRQAAKQFGISKSTVHKYLKKYIDSPSEQKELLTSTPNSPNRPRKSFRSISRNATSVVGWPRKKNTFLGRNNYTTKG